MHVRKYYLRPGMNEVELPVGAKFLSAFEQRPEVNVEFCAWYLVEDVEETELRNIVALATGQDFHSTAAPKFLATVLCHGGRLVFHLFEI